MKIPAACVYIDACLLMTIENKSSISDFLPKLHIKLSTSSPSNSYPPKQQKTPAILAAYFHLLNGKYSVVFIIFFYHGASNSWTGTKRRLNTHIPSYLWTIIFAEWRCCIDLPVYSQNYSDCLAKLYFFKQTEDSRTGWMWFQFQPTTFLSPKSHIRPEKSALCWLLFCTKRTLSCQKTDYKG